MLNKIFNINSQSRIVFYDNVKFLMIALMFLGHFADDVVKGTKVTGNFCPSIYLFIYAFHMPMLLFISGLFYSEKNWKKKVLFYFCCGFALKFFMTLTNIVFYGEIKFKLLSDSRLPWFMFVLAAYQIIMRLLYQLNDRYKWILLILLILLGCFIGYDKKIHDYLYFSRIVVFFPVFFAGTMLSPEKLQDFLKKNFKKLVIPALLILCAWFYICFFKEKTFYDLRSFFTGRNPFPEELYGIGPLIRFGCYLITGLTSFSLLVLIPKRRIPFISTLGSHTLNVYFWHWTVMLLLTETLDFDVFFTTGWLAKVICLVLPIALSFVLAGVKVFNYPLQWLKKAIYS